MRLEKVKKKVMLIQIRMVMQIPKQREKLIQKLKAKPILKPKEKRRLRWMAKLKWMPKLIQKVKLKLR